MRFSGYAQLRRGIIEHLMDGRLSLQEYAVLTVLIMLVDKSSGIGEINAPVLRFYIPGLSSDAAKRVLASLEQKGYILRQITPRSPFIYPYAVDKYIPTVEPHKLRQLSIAKARNSRRFGDIEYLKPAPDGAPETTPDAAPETAPEGAQYYKKQEEISKKREERTTLTDIGNPASWSTPSGLQAEAERTSEATTSLQGGGPLGGQMAVPQVASMSASVAASVAAGAGVGLRWSGQDGGFIDVATGRSVPHTRVCQRIAPLGLEWRGGEFYQCESGELVSWQHAQRLIGGDQPEARNA